MATRLIIFMTLQYLNVLYHNSNYMEKLVLHSGRLGHILVPLPTELAT